MFALVSFPALAILWLFHEGRVAVLYDEPKLHVTHIVGGAFLLALAWGRRNRLSTPLGAALKHPFFLAFGAFLTWGAASALWADVPHNVVYELKQYLFLFVLLLALCAWARLDHRVPEMLLHALVLALAPVTLVSCVQLVVETPWLPPIDPGYGVRHPSFLGYKNPMALALLGQIFLLFYLTRRAFCQRLWARWPLAIYAAAQVACLATLESRTSYAAFIATSLGLCVALVLGSGRAARRWRVLAVAATLALLFTLALSRVPAARERFATILVFLTNPASYLESDRGTYLLNTLNMVRHNPLGVGLGEWQTQYPVYRQHRRYLAFTPETQTRRAHSDHVQLLGELGPLGLGLWAWLLLSALGPPLRRFWRERRERDLFLAAQLCALFLSMGTDAVLDLPYSRLQLFLVCGLAIFPDPPESGGEQAPDSSKVRRAGLIALIGGVGIGAGVMGLHHSAAALGVRFHHERATEFLTQPGEERSAWESLLAVERSGRRLDTCPACSFLNHSKTSFRTNLERAEAAWWRGETAHALDLARASLERHPYQPNIFLLLSKILAEDHPEHAAAFAQASSYVMEEASTGFRLPYPLLPPSDGLNLTRENPPWTRKPSY